MTEVRIESARHMHRLETPIVAPTCDDFVARTGLGACPCGRQADSGFNVAPAPQSADGAAYWTRLLEPIVAAHYTLRTRRQVRRTGTLMRHPKHPCRLL
ncbi:hypothetical protein D9M72_561540 [compost metagenome]